MATSDEGTSRPPQQAQRQYLERTLAALFLAVEEVNEELTQRGSVSESTRQELQSQVVNTVTQLRQYRREDGIEWREATPFDDGPEAIVQRAWAGDEREVTPEGQRDAAPRTERAAARIPAQVLYESALDLIDIAHDLSLTPDVDVDTGDSQVYPDPV